MKKIYFVYLSLSLLALYILTTSSSLGRATDDNVGNTGAPGENQLCSNCHNNGSYGTVSVNIQVFESGTTNPVSFYVPNTLYDMRVTVSGSSGTPNGYGFQLTTMTGTNTPYAAYSDLASNVKQKLITSGSQSGRTYVEHNGVLNNNQFNFKWTSPSSGNVTFYASGVACNDNNGSGGDRAGNANLSLPQAPSLSVQSQVNNITCFGNNDGSITLNITSGVPPYSFEWSDGAVTQNRTNLASGNYSVVVTDNLGQSFEESFDLDNPTPITLDIAVTQPTLIGGSGSIDLFISGGTPPYSWSINEGPANELPPLIAGDYQIVVQDNNGCEITNSFTMVDPEGIQAIVTVQDVTCYGLTNGQIDLTISGGFEPYEVVWTESAGITPEGYAAGTYTATITDVEGNQTEITAVVSEPEPVLIATAFDPILCSGGTTLVVVSAQGGTAPYTGTGTFVAQAGEQQYTVIDAQGCTYNTFITLEEPAPFLGDSISAEMSCTGGDIILEVTASGGVLPYAGTGEIHFENPGQYAVPITDANGCTAIAHVAITAIDGPQISSIVEEPSCWGLCDGSIALNTGEDQGSYAWSDGVDGPTRNNLCNGTYTCTFTGTDGCVLVNTYLIESPDSLMLLINAPDSICSGQTASVSTGVIGGVGPYEITWSNGALDLMALSAGVYTATLTDANGCVTTNELSISNYPEISVLSVDTSDPGCFGTNTGSIAVEATSALGELQYQWTPNVSSASQATDIGSGTYVIEVVDGVGCTVVVNAELNDPSVLTLQANVSDNTDGTGTIEALANGGTPPYSYLWNNGSDDSTIDATTGFYSVVVTDAAGCSSEINGLEITTSIVEIGSTTVIAYPNPFGAQLRITASGPFMVMNTLGEVYYSGYGQSALFTDEWPAGIYVVVQEGKPTQRIMKQ